MLDIEICWKIKESQDGSTRGHQEANLCTMASLKYNWSVYVIHFLQIPLVLHPNHLLKMFSIQTIDSTLQSLELFNSRLIYTYLKGCCNIQDCFFRFLLIVLSVPNTVVLLETGQSSLQARTKLSLKIYAFHSTLGLLPYFVDAVLKSSWFKIVCRKIRLASLQITYF